MNDDFQIPEDQFADSDGVKLRYRVSGQGEPLILIMGYGPPSTLWHRSLPYFNDRFECVYYDHRGTGQSDTPEEGYSIEQYAIDARTILDTMGWESAHVYGGSMGGMIGLQLTLDAPERVRTLVVGSTSCGIWDDTKIGALPEVSRGMELLVAGKIDEGIAVILPILYGDLVSSRPEVSEIARKFIFAEPPKRLPQFSAELGWLLGWDVSDRLGEIKCPALVQHGSDDCLFPIDHALRLFEGLSNAELRIYKSPHSYTVIDPARILRAVGDWILSRNSAVTS